MGLFGKKSPAQHEPLEDSPARAGHSIETDRTLTHHGEEMSKTQLKRATRTRKIWSLISAFCLLISVIFLILVEVGNTKVGKVRSSIYFARLNLSQIIPSSVPSGASFTNSIAQTLGLHDYYQVGLWNYCQGNVGVGINECAPTKTLYWFNPVEILLSQLLAGATIALPTQVTTVLRILKIASQWMFGLFLTGACADFVMIFLTPLAIYSRWANLAITPLTFLAALCTTIATILATVIFIILKMAAESVAELNLKAKIGVKMFVFMWIAAGFSILALLIQLCLCCCCASRRDVKKGKKKGNRHAYTDAGHVAISEKPKRTMFGRKKV
ncbi:hypothetical protein EG328_005389 [Venturia inaequalis]|uniref:Integral membrane protein n=1 Tax=Venturia inaequalis TaxID=5025 RepID=A0A8H3VF31_VENIN|nr:hypothetical protein EG328_005389 [Venturia inaequalis]KAE9992408.1 hypothetical protein EG327_009050 [Venturia inaequalis]RDI82323.1 hypothetical protein Vi05172_g7595 [Venturia inaequalis]